MSELLAKVLTGVLRVLLIPVTDWLVRHNIITDDESIKLIAEIAVYAGTIGWTVWAWVKSHRQTLISRAVGGPLTGNEVKLLDKAGMAPSVMTPANQVPVLSTGDGSVVVTSTGDGTVKIAGTGSGT